jgi:hypothetical protein
MDDTYPEAVQEEGLNVYCDQCYKQEMYPAEGRVGEYTKRALEIHKVFDILHP